MGHVASNAPIKSKFSRSNNYRSRGLNHIKGESARAGVYDKPSKVRAALRELGIRPRPNDVEPASKEHADRYKISHGKNFSHTRAPYGNQAHHLLPISAFGQPTFTPEAMAILKRCDGYDINDGTNIIFLPSDERSAKFHGLPVHNGDHPKYSKDVKNRLNSLAQELNELAVKGHKNADPSSDIPGALREHEDALWDVVCAMTDKLK